MIKRSNIHFLAILCFLFTDCQSLPNPSSNQFPNLSLTTAEKDYFKKIALGVEFGKKDKKIIKWGQNINVFLTGKSDNVLEQELNKIIQELDSLTFGIEIKRVRKKADANFIVFLGHGKDYVKEYESKAKPYVKSNWGFVYLNWNRAIIHSGTMYVDVFRAKEKVIQRHLLREEFTQGLGLLNDAYDYEDSIFQQNWTQTTNYIEIDKKVIQTLYHPHIKANMTYSEVQVVLDSL